MIIKEIQMRPETSEKIVQACCNYFERIKRFINIEKRNGIWFITICFEDDLDYFAFMTAQRK